MSNNNSTRRVYTKAFKQEAVQLTQMSGKTMRAIERELGLSKGILKQWVRQAYQARIFGRGPLCH